MSERLEYLARRAADDPFYLAAPLAVYARSEGIDDAVLAALLGCERDTLTLLRLCRRPRGEGFGADVARIAEHFAIDPLALAEIVRHADALDTLREGAGTGEKGALMAARDRRPSPPDPLSHGETGRSESFSPLPDGLSDPPVLSAPGGEGSGVRDGEAGE